MSLPRFQFVREGEDKLWWNPSKKGLFVVSSYNVLVCNGGIPFPREGIWWTKVPLRLAFLLG